MLIAVILGLSVTFLLCVAFWLTRGSVNTGQPLAGNAVPTADPAAGVPATGVATTTPVAQAPAGAPLATTAGATTQPPVIAVPPAGAAPAQPAPPVTAPAPPAQRWWQRMPGVTQLSAVPKKQLWVTVAITVATIVGILVMWRFLASDTKPPTIATTVPAQSPTTTPPHVDVTTVSSGSWSVATFMGAAPLVIIGAILIGFLYDQFKQGKKRVFLVVLGVCAIVWLVGMHNLLEGPVYLQGIVRGEINPFATINGSLVLLGIIIILGSLIHGVYKEWKSGLTRVFGVALVLWFLGPEHIVNTSLSLRGHIQRLWLNLGLNSFTDLDNCLLVIAMVLFVLMFTGRIALWRNVVLVYLLFSVPYSGSENIWHECQKGGKACISEFGTTVTKPLSDARMSFWMSLPSFPSISTTTETIAPTQAVTTLPVAVPVVPQRATATSLHNGILEAQSGEVVQVNANCVTRYVPGTYYFNARSDSEGLTGQSSSDGKTWGPLSRRSIYVKLCSQEPITVTITLRCPHGDCS